MRRVVQGEATFMALTGEPLCFACGCGRWVPLHRVYAHEQTCEQLRKGEQPQRSLGRFASGTADG